MAAHPSVPAWPRNMLMVGCGNMGGAMLAGWLAAGVAPERFTVVAPRLAQVPAGVTLLRELPLPDHSPRPFDAVLLGFKPYMFRELAPGLATALKPDTVVLSMLAGVELATLAARLPHSRTIVRVMPNLAVAIGKSPVAMVEHGADAAQREAILALMAPLGTPEWLADERLLDAVTALAGSGPAFVYRFIAALAASGAVQGIPREQAGRLALAMVEGAAALAAQSPHDPDELARRVASPGGVTQAGLDVLDHDDALIRLIGDTLRAAVDRSAEMAVIARG